VTTFLAFAFVLGVLVFVHELGHFIAAKRVGIRVLKFQLGFNPTIVSVRRGDTEYGIGALPLGGYVKMAGEHADDTRSGQPDEFLSKTKWERFQVLIMGPLMNLVLAVILLAVVLYQGAEVPVFEGQPPVVARVTRDSPAAQAGIQPGDRIVSVAGRSVHTWEQFYVGIGTRPHREVEIGLLRDGRERRLKITPVPMPDSRFEIGEIGVLPDVHPWLRSVNPGEPGERGGLKAGDVIVAVDGEPMTFQTHFRQAIARNPEQPITITVRRDGAIHSLSVTPGRKGDVGWLGVLPADETKSVQPGAVEALGMSVTRNVEMTQFIFATVWDLLRGQTSPKQLMGPVGIAQLSGESAELGWVALFALMAQLSLNLGLLNLLPIPILDGGHILIMGLEGVARRDFSVRVKEKMLLAGFVVLMMLMVTVIYNDLTRITWIERLMPWR
jgi:regulator of sigma E protease